MSELEGQEQSKLEEITLDHQTAKALGNGLGQIFTKNLLGEILETTRSLKEKSIGDETKDGLEIIELETTRVMDFLKAINERKEIKVIYIGANTWDFKFSEDGRQEEKLQQGEITLSEDLSTKLKNALYHNLGNRLAPILGFAQLIVNTSKDPNARNNFKSVGNESEEMFRKFALVIPAKGRYRIKLITDSRGNTDISQVPVSAPSREINSNP